MSRPQALGLSVFGMLFALVSAIAGMTAWKDGMELERACEGGYCIFPAGLEYICFALFGAPPLVIIGGTLVFVAAEAAPRPPDPPTPF